MNIANVIRNLIIRAKAEGVDQTAQSLKGLAQAHDQAGKSAQQHATASETSARRQLSMEQAFDRLERRFNTTARAQQDYAKVQAQVNAAVAQNPALQARANEVLAFASAHYGRAQQAQGLFTKGMEAAQAGAIMLSGRLGVVGSVLIGLGPAGLAAGAGLGLVAYGISRIAHASSDLADRAGKMVDFAQTTGLTTTALQGLIKAGGQVGVEADKVGTSVERFTIQIEELRRGSGELYDSVRRVDQGLAEQLAGTRSTADAWDLLAEAYKRADENQKNLIAKGAFGQRNIGAGRLLGETADAGGLDVLIKRSKELGAIDQERLKTLDRIGDRLNELRRSSIDRFLIRGAEQELQVAEDFYSVLNKIQDWMDNFSISETWNKFLGQLERAAAAALGNQPGPAGQPPALPEPTELERSFKPTLRGSPGLSEGPSVEFELAKYKELIAVLGAAATPAEQLKLKILELGQAARRSGASQETYNRALAALNAQSTAGIRNRINDLQFEVSLLGRSSQQVAQMRAEWDVLRTVREAAVAAGKGEEEINVLLEQERENLRDIIQELANANIERQRQTEEIEAQREATQRLAAARHEAANAAAREAEEYARAKAEYEKFKFETAFLPSGFQYGPGSVWMGKDGRYSQFNPAGYQSTLAPLFNGRPLDALVNDVLSSGGSLEQAIARLQQPDIMPSTKRDKLIQDLTNQMEELRRSTDVLNSTMQDILSPLYGTDPRTMHLGYRAGSGVYRPTTTLTDAQIGAPNGFPGWGMLPGMANGGSITVPGGYSSVDNALLPVASGEKIRVSREDDRPTITINAPITINGMEGDRSDARETGFQMSQALAQVVQRGMIRG